MTVTDPTAHPQPAEERTYEQIAGRNAAIGAVIGFIICVAAVFGLAISADIDPVPSLGLAAFVGIWSGVGFGFMVGGTKYIAGNH